MKRCVSVLLGVLMWAVITVPASAQQDITIPQDDTLRLGGTLFPATLDPLFVTSTTDMQFVNNLFMGLTRIDPQTGEVRAGLAQSWDVSDDGLTWTFTLRQDVPWVRYTPETGDVSAFGMVSVSDVMTAIERICSPLADTYYTRDVFAPIIPFCVEGQAGNFTTNVEASSNHITIALKHPVPYFDMLAALATIAPVNSEVIDLHGETWTYPQSILTSGAFALADFQPNTSLTLVSNPFLPDDLRGDGNINRVTYTRLLDTATTFRLFNEGLLDRAPIPAPLIESVLTDEDYAGQAFTIPTSAMYFIGFDTAQPPFDDVNLRRAFASVFNRGGFVEDIRGGRGVPIFHIIPEGLTGSPPAVYESLIGYVPDSGRGYLALSNYPNCARLPEITVYTYQGAGGWVSYLRDAVQLELGCVDAVFDIIELPFDQLRNAINPSTPVEGRPQMFTFGFGADYNDASTFADIVACGERNYFGRQGCTPADDLIQQANESDDSATRQALYMDAMTAFFGADGEWPLIPLFQLERYFVVQPWLSGPFAEEGRFDVMHFDAYTLNVPARADALVCHISSETEANLRSGAGINFDRVGTFPVGQAVRAIAQTRGADSYVWWYLESGAYVREDVVTAEGYCRALPLIGA